MAFRVLKYVVIFIIGVGVGCATMAVILRHTIDANAVIAKERVDEGSKDRTSEDSGVKRVYWRDIGEHLAIIGDLGFPVGTVLTIQGRWIVPVESGTVRDPYSRAVFKVTKINRNRVVDIVLPANRIFYQGPFDDRVRVRPNDGERWELRGYETGSNTGYPKGVLQETYGKTPMPSSPELLAISNHAYVCKFCYFSSRRMDDPE